MKNWEKEEVLQYSLGEVVYILAVKLKKSPDCILRLVLSSHLYNEFLIDYKTEMWLEPAEHIADMFLIEINNGVASVRKYIRESCI